MSGIKGARRIGAARRASADYTSLFSAVDFDVDSISGLKSEPAKKSTGEAESIASKKIAMKSFSKDQVFDRELYLFVIKAEGVDESDHRKDEAWVKAQLGQQLVYSQGQINGSEIQFDASFMLVFKDLPCTIDLQIQGPGGSYGRSGELMITMEMYLNNDAQEFFIPILDNARLLVGVRFDAFQKELCTQRFIKLQRDPLAALSVLNPGDNHPPLPHKLKRTAITHSGSSMSRGARHRRKSIDMDLTNLKSLGCDNLPESSMGTVAHKNQWEIGKLFEIMPGKLSFVSHFSGQETMIESFHDKDILHYVRSSLHEKYTPVRADFGPVDLSVVTRFCEFLRVKRACKKLGNKHLVYVTDDVAEHRTNAACLICSYLVLEEGLSPEEAWEPFSKIDPSPFVPFRDASRAEAPSRYTLGILDVLNALTRAVSLGWYNPLEFDANQYERLARDGMSQVCPKLLMFSDPGHKSAKAWDDFVRTLLEKKAKCVIRANYESEYAGKHFQERDVRFHECRFEAGQTPSDDTVTKFFTAVDAEAGVVGVHSKDGRHRSGLLAALWIMREHKWTPNEAMAWIRLVKPGSIVGRQQNFVKECWIRGFDGHSLATRHFLGGRGKSLRSKYSSLTVARFFSRSKSDATETVSTCSLDSGRPDEEEEAEESGSQDLSQGQNTTTLSLIAGRGARRGSLPDMGEAGQVRRSGSSMLEAKHARGKGGAGDTEAWERTEKDEERGVGLLPGIGTYRRRSLAGPPARTHSS